MNVPRMLDYIKECLESNDPSMHKIIRYVDDSVKNEFRVADPEQFAQQWGERKGNTLLTISKLKRCFQYLVKKKKQLRKLSRWRYRFINVKSNTSSLSCHSSLPNTSSSSCQSSSYSYISSSTSNKLMEGRLTSPLIAVNQLQHSLSPNPVALVSLASLSSTPAPSAFKRLQSATSNNVKTTSKQIISPSTLTFTDACQTESCSSMSSISYATSTPSSPTNQEASAEKNIQSTAKVSSRHFVDLTTSYVPEKGFLSSIATDTVCLNPPLITSGSSDVVDKTYQKNMHKVLYYENNAMLDGISVDGVLVNYLTVDSNTATASITETALPQREKLNAPIHYDMTRSNSMMEYLGFDNIPLTPHSFSDSTFDPVCSLNPTFRASEQLTLFEGSKH